MFERTGQTAYMAYSTYPGEWSVKPVAWIAATTEGDHVIEETVKRHGDSFTNLRRWTYVFETAAGAHGFARSKEAGTRYIAIKNGILAEKPSRTCGE